MTKLVAIICYYTGLNVLFYWLNRETKRIITFHSVLPDALFRAGVANGVSNSLSEFRLIVDECAKQFRFSTDLFDPKTLTITFDDGYRNQYSVAFKELKSRGVPACLFVAGGIGENCLLIDKLLHWVAEAPIEYIPGRDRLRYWTKDVWPRFMADHEARGAKVLAELDTKYSYEKIISSLPEDYLKDRLTGISKAERDEMRAAGWLLGWHTKSHYPLSGLTEDALREELTPPDEYTNVCLSYPYGNPVEVGARALEMAKELGYPSAVSNTNTAEENASRHFLPRMSLSADKYLLHFELSGCKYFIKHRKLLPRGF